MQRDSTTLRFMKLNHGPPLCGWVEVPTVPHRAAAASVGCVSRRTALARGVRAPASTLTAVREKLPDTGYDEKKEPSTLHAPSATSSCKKDDNRVRCLGCQLPVVVGRCA